MKRKTQSRRIPINLKAVSPGFDGKESPQVVLADADETKAKLEKKSTMTGRKTTRRAEPDRRALTAFHREFEAELIAGLCIRAEIAPLNDDYANLAEDRYGARGLDLRAAAMEIIATNGMPDPQNWPDRIQAAYSSANGTAIFAGLVNAALTAPFRTSRDTTRGWIIEKNVSNFKPNRRMRLRQSNRFEERPRGGKADHMRLDDTMAETYRVKEFAKQFVVDETDLADDDVEALTTPAGQLGEMALALKLDLIYTVLLANESLADGTALFHADHSNFTTGSSLNESNLDSGMAAIEKQTENDVPLDTPARYLIVPPSEKGNARRLARNMGLTDGANLTVRSEPRLELGVTDPVSKTVYAGATGDWFLSSGEGAPTIEFGYIDDKAPRADMWQLKEGQWGVGVAAKWRVGAKALAHHALRKHEA